MDKRNWMLRCRPAAAMALLAVLAACGGGGGGGGGAAPATLQGNFFPLAVGDRWVYASSPGDLIVTVRASGTRTVDGQNGVVVITEDPTKASAESVYVVTADSVRQEPASGDALAVAIGALDVMRFPLHAGDRWTQIDKTIDTGIDFDGDGHQERASVKSEVEVIGLETVNTPVASFAGSLHQRSTLTVGVQLSAMALTVTVVTTVDDWYAPDIGPVRTTIEISGDGVSTTQTLALTGYRVGTRSSDSGAPTVAMFSPADKGAARPDGRLTVGFSAAMAAASGVAATSLGGPGGQAVGRARRGFTFTADGSLGSGRDGPRIGTGATELFGNALAQARSWSFDVDTPGL